MHLLSQNMHNIYVFIDLIIPPPNKVWRGYIGITVSSGGQAVGPLQILFIQANIILSTCTLGRPELLKKFEKKN